MKLRYRAHTRTLKCPKFFWPGYYLIRRAHSPFRFRQEAPELMIDACLLTINTESDTLCFKDSCSHVFLLPQVILLLAHSEAYEFVLAGRGDVSVVNAQKFTLGSHVSNTALFPIRPLALGVMEICVDAVSAEGSDSRVQRVFVKVG